nr:ABC transporter ATP-binding protein/permease [Lachnospiraceae bacterium]
MKRMKNTDTYRRILLYLKPYGIFVLLSLIMAFLFVAGSLYMPVIFGEGIDRIIKAGKIDFAGLYPIIRIGIVTALATALAQWIMNLSNNYITYHVVKKIRNDAIDKLEILPLKEIDASSTGEIVSRIIADVEQFSDGLLLGFTQLFTALITIVGTVGLLISIHPLLAAIIVLVTPLSLLFAAFVAGKTFHLFQDQSDIRGQQTALIDEMIGNQKVVKANGYEEKSFARFVEINEQLRERSLKATFFSSLVNPGTRFINSVVYALAGVSGGILCITHGITVGQLSCVLSYATQYTKPFNEISGVVTEFQNALVCAQRIFEFIDKEPQTKDKETAVELVHANGEVILENVAFSYEEDKALIEDLNLDVKPGERIAIVGPTGCGKTTLINLLMRFYEINRGQIRISGKDYREYTRKSLRSAYGMVLQDTWLFEGTVLENIAVGKPDATREEVIEAAKAAHAHSFIKRME